MHTHFGALVIAGSFLGVLLAGTLWRLLCAHAAVSNNQFIQNLGKAGAFQY